MVSEANETNPNKWKNLCRETTDKAVFGASGDDPETDGVKESNSGVKKMQRMTRASDQSFLDYLLNFDLNSVFIVNTGIEECMTNSASPLTKSICENPSFNPTICEETYISHDLSNMDQDCYSPVLTSCQIKVSGSCAEEQPLPTLESSESSESQSLLTGLIDNQEFTRSPEPQAGLKIINPTNKQPKLVDSTNLLKETDTTQLYCKESQQNQTSLLPPTFDSNADASQWFKANTDTPDSDANGEVFAGSKGNIFTELSLAELHCQSNDPDESIKQPQQKQEDKVTPFAFNHCPVSSAEAQGIVCNERLCDGGSVSRVLDTTLAGPSELQANSLCREKQLLFSMPISEGPKDDEINNNSNKSICPDATILTVSLGLACTQDNNAAVGNNDVKSSADSDCTLIEEQDQINSPDKDRQDMTFQTRLNPTPVFGSYEEERQHKQHDSCESGREPSREEPTESTTDPFNTESSVSMLADVSQKPLCLPPTSDNNNQRRESAGQDSLQKVGKNEEASYTVKVNQCEKKRSKQKFRKHTHRAHGLNAGNSNRVFLLHWILVFRNWHALSILG